jgi:predicted amidophosphoribosyltransferase
VLARKDELGNRAAFCAGCGWGRRFLGGIPAELPETCPDCGQPVLAECPACAEGITSLMQITCSACGEALRDAELFGRPIRRKPERHAGVGAAPQCAGEAAEAFAAEAATPECAGEAAAAFADAE